MSKKWSLSGHPQSPEGSRSFLPGAVFSRGKRRRPTRSLAGPIIEPLESRCLLTVDPVAIDSLLAARSLADRSSFYVYQDADSGFNHGFPSGVFASSIPTQGKIHINPAAIDDPASTTGTTTDPNRMDQVRGTVMSVAFDPLALGEYVGVNIEEPENWGVTQVGVGYDLRGATQVVFDARSPTPGGVDVQFGVDQHTAAFIHIPQSTTYSTMTIPLNTLGLTSSDLSNVHILFSIAENDMHGAQGGIVLLDSIRFNPAPTSQQSQLGFPLANQTFGVVPVDHAQSGRVPIPIDQLLKNLTTTYESSLTGLSLMANGSPADLAAARTISDAFDYALHHDSHGDPLPTAADGSTGLHNGYSSGDLALYNNQQPPKAGQQGDIRLAGFTLASLSPTGYALLLDGASGGNNAFAILELATAYQTFGDSRYLDDAKLIGHWIAGNLADTSGTGYGGYYTGYPDQGIVPKVKQEGKSVENNADIFSAFSVLAQLDPANASLWTARANTAGDFVMAMFDATSGRFNAGTALPGASGAGIDPSGPRRGNDVINTFDFLDSDSFTTLALAASPRYHDQIDWRLPVRYVLNHFAQTVTAGGRTYQGFGIVSQPTLGPNGVAWEFTGQFVVLAQFIDQLYGVSEFESTPSSISSRSGRRQHRLLSTMEWVWSRRRCRTGTCYRPMSRA